MTKSIENEAIDVLHSLDDEGKAVHRAYFLIGSGSDYLKNQVISKLKTRLVSEQFEPFDFVSFSADDLASFNELEMALNRPPFGKNKMIVLKNAHNLPKHDFAKLMTLKVPEFTVLVVTSENDKISLSAFGDSIIVSQYNVSEEVVKTWIKTKFKNEGHEVSLEAIKELKERLNGDFALLDLEIKKVSLYAGKGVKVELEDISNVVENIPEQGIYELIDAIILKNKEEALAFYEKMIHSTNPIPENIILSEILRNLSQILLIKDFIDKGIKNSEKIAEHLRTIYSKNLNKYVVARIIKNTEKYSLKDIFLKYEALQEIDAKSKIGEIELPLALRLFVESV
jgi:DNA polymerase-3 subunit delta